MISSEVQRTLVKSPPELWTELSDPAALGRHLGEFGEIRITRVEPEKAVEWEAEAATGTVLIKPTGWGTRVTLTLTRELPPAEEPAAPEPQALTSEPQAAVPESAAEVPESEAPPQPEPPIEAVPATAESIAADPAHWPAEEEQAADGETADEQAEWQELEFEYEPEPDPEPRRGFLSRLFRRRRREMPPELEGPSYDAAQPLGAYRTLASEDPLEAWPGAEEETLADADADADADAEPLAPREQPRADADSELLAPQVQPVAVGEPLDAIDAEEAEPPQDPASAGESAEGNLDMSAELRGAEETAAEEVNAVLSAMLDRLGTAHHRPFSRS
jgi:hypothetical protein